MMRLDHEELSYSVKNISDASFLVASARTVMFDFADACCFEFEDVLVDALEADMLQLGADPSPALKPQKMQNFKSGKTYDVVFLVANNIRKLSNMVALMDSYKIKASATYAYVFGSYVHDLKYIKLPGARRHIPRYKRLQKIDHFFGAIKENIPILSELFDKPFHYSPMAVDVLKVAGDDQQRYISINGFGRQETNLNNLLADTFNRPSSPHIYQHTNAIKLTSLVDWKRHRDLFWHTLRSSQISLAFDSLYFNQNGLSKHSFVGPRWYESLATGTVIAGHAPTGEENESLLDWDKSTINLPSNPQKGMQKLLELLAEPEALRKIGRENIRQMHLKHDWRYRIGKMLSETGMPVPTALDNQLKLLTRNAKNFE